MRGRPKKTVPAKTEESPQARFFRAFEAVRVYYSLRGWTLQSNELESAILKFAEATKTAEPDENIYSDGKKWDYSQQRYV